MYLYVHGFFFYIYSKNRVTLCSVTKSVTTYENACTSRCVILYDINCFWLQWLYWHTEVIFGRFPTCTPRNWKVVSDPQYPNLCQAPCTISRSQNMDCYSLDTLVKLKYLNSDIVSFAECPFGSFTAEEITCKSTWPCAFVHDTLCTSVTMATFEKGPCFDSHNKVHLKLPI